MEAINLIITQDNSFNLSQPFFFFFGLLNGGNNTKIRWNYLYENIKHKGWQNQSFFQLHSILPFSHSFLYSFLVLFLFIPSRSLWEHGRAGRRKRRRRKCNEACFDKTGIPLGNVLLKCRCPLAISAPERRETVLTEEASLCSGFCVTVDLFSV